MRVVIGVFAAALVFAGLAFSQPAQSTPFRVRLERTVCFGTCPEYVVTVRADRRVVYLGRRGVLVKGVRRARITQSVLRNLRRAVSSTGVFSLDSRYDEMSITDLPSAKLTVQVGSRTKRIYHYLGDLTAPEKLSRLECTVDRMLRTKRWVGSGNEYVCSGRAEDVLDSGEARTGGRAEPESGPPARAGSSGESDSEPWPAT